ncbi:MAG: CcmD family protein [Ferruginibacter sp.]
MNNFLTRTMLVLLCCLSGMMVFAQNKPAMADIMRSNGKIYVVVGCCLIILTGLFLYVWRVERKIKNIEKGNV